MIDIASQLTKGLKELHKLDILHEHIRPTNILICKIGELYTYKLADYSVFS